ncbi:MAG: hypothetical protein MJE12_08450 [Alphaproteobacteria bacterium]|nr:hypothetical protein [Alphaproteobacteria bacterium]
MVRKLAAVAFGVFLLTLVSGNPAQALMCGANDCVDAGAADGSPYSIGDPGAFSRSVLAVSATDPGAGFFHAVTFTLNEFSSIAGTFGANNTADGFNILGLTLDLFTAANVQIPGTFLVPNGNGAAQFVNFAYGGLAAGDYFFKISGQLGPDAKNGQYAAEFSVSEVPLPPAVWLFISAILGMVSFARIRRNKQSV